MADFDEYVEQTQERPPRTDSISKKRLDELGQGSDANATIAIYTRDKNRALQAFEPKFPKDAAVLFSQAISDSVHRGDKYYIIDDEDTTGYKIIFNWIRQCRDTHSDRETPEPTVENESDPFTPYITVLLAAQKLRIPSLTLHVPLVKKLLSLSRKAIISLDIVRQIYDSCDPLNALGLQEVAATSIFEGWYSWKLEEPEYEEYMYDLADLRDGIPELDEGLHEAVTKKDAWIKERREKKRREREEADSGAAIHDFAGDNGSQTQQDCKVDESWNRGRQTNVETPTWMNEAESMDQDAKHDWSAAAVDKTGGQDDSGAGGAGGADINGGTWADEMNEAQGDGHDAQTYVLQPAICNAGW